MAYQLCFKLLFNWSCFKRIYKTHILRFLDKNSSKFTSIQIKNRGGRWRDFSTLWIVPLISKIEINEIMFPQINYSSIFFWKTCKECKFTKIKTIKQFVTYCQTLLDIHYNDISTFKDLHVGKCFVIML